ncbi:pyridoxal phosphate homeostasis protein-like [Juglans regia]|uniref:Pyridoxal phosphate homeostasis protein n=2 Tax=Juglans regia TaxID=51240 RepID=A0A2I4HMK9_JUGRE|nr:pyridoxal phosphate homeostasis protein-like [Juglans regia]
MIYILNIRTGLKALNSLGEQSGAKTGAAVLLQCDSDMATSAAATEGVAAALRSVLRRAHLSAERSGRGCDRVRVVAVSKTKSVSLIRQVYDAGHRCFGENYVQELIEKAPQLPDDIEWHFIGNLQSNKAKPLLAGVPSLAMVESVDDVKIANHLDRAVASIGRKPLKVLVQVNTSGETSKFGVEPSGCVELVKHVSLSCPNLEFCGLMTIGMLDYSSTPENFKTLSNCRTEVCKALDIPEEQCELSMGMSADFEQAIEMGSTNVRVGSTIFGAREYPNKQVQT